MRVSGCHVVVTGGSRGIGAELAREFARRGAIVTVVARSPDSLEKVAHEIGGNAVVADLSDDLVVDGLIEHIEGDKYQDHDSFSGSGCNRYVERNRIKRKFSDGSGAAVSENETDPNSEYCRYCAAHC